LSPLKQLL